VCLVNEANKLSGQANGLMGLCKPNNTWLGEHTIIYINRGIVCGSNSCKLAANPVFLLP